ncbi:TPA: hypothetical protein P0327_002201 [Listeria monocytogenes]|nr:hypothetical protein [Listeria monocytogenes]
MRPIEFRAFSMEHNMYMVGFGVLPVEYTEKEFGYENEIILFTEFNGEIRCISETVGQFTGLKDKNGKKIFEGDIGWDEHNECYGVVKFEEGKFLYVWENIAEDLREVADSIEIYGNIHENPDLLEVAE